jgi:hypothetical protein
MLQHAVSPRASVLLLQRWLAARGMRLRGVEKVEDKPQILVGDGYQATLRSAPMGANHKMLPIDIRHKRPICPHTW